MANHEEKLHFSNQAVSKTDILLIFFLSMIFTCFFIGLAWATIFLFFQSLMNTFVPDPWPSEESVKVDWIETLKPLFLILLLILLILLIVGIVIKRFKLSFASSILLLLPIFSYFSISMTWLSGLSALLMLWLPLAENYPEIVCLGDSVFFPLYASIYGGFFLFGWSAFFLPLLIMIAGVFLFFLGVLSWVVGESSKHEFVSVLVYRSSRHPQYLGYLLATYGMMILIGFRPGLEHWLPVPTLFWLLSALCIVGVAIHEENLMLAKNIPAYREWRAHTSFLFPFPGVVSRFFLLPLQVLLKKDWPETDREIVFVLFIYFLLFVTFSIPIVLLFCPYPPLF